MTASPTLDAHRHHLDELVETSMDVLRLARAQANALRDPGPMHWTERHNIATTAANLAFAVDRAGRAVRQTILLIERLQHPARAPAPSAGRQAHPDRGEAGHAAPEPGREILVADRLDPDRPDPDEDLGDRPDAQVLAAIGRGLAAATSRLGPGRHHRPHPIFPLPLPTPVPAGSPPTDSGYEAQEATGERGQPENLVETERRLRLPAALDGT